MKYIWSILILLCINCKAQQIRTIPNFEKLPGPVIHKILQDREGYLWYATTESGLCRDNGYQVDIFVGDKQSGFSRSDRYVNQMCLTQEDNILFSTNTGAWLLDKQTYSIERLDTTATAGRAVQAVVSDAVDGSYWLTTGSTVLHLSKERKLLDAFNITHNGNKQSALTLFQDSRNILWLLLHQGGLQRYNRTQNSFEICQWEYECSPYVMVEDTTRNCYWMGTLGGGIVKYQYNDGIKQGQVTSYPMLEENLQHNNIYSICLAKDKLWLSTIDNLYCYHIEMNGDKLTEVDTSGFIPTQKKISNNPYLDEKGNIWVPSYTPNPFVIMPANAKIKRYEVEQMETMTGYPLIADVIEREDDAFWLIQSRVGLMYYRPTTKQLVFADAEIALNSGFAQNMIVKCKNNKGIWRKRGNQLLHSWYENESIKTRIVTELDYAIHSIYESQKGYLLIGTNDAIWQMDIKEQQAKQIVTGTGMVIDICQMFDGTIYFISQHKGFAQLAPKGKITTLDSKYQFDKLESNNEDILWLSSPDGIVASYDIRNAKLNLDKMAYDDRGCVIKELSVDENGHVWFLTSLYVKEYNPENHSSRIFNTTDSNIRINYFQDLKSQGGKICFSGAGGIFVVESSLRLKEMSIEKQPVVSDMLIGDRTIYLKSGQKEVNVEAGASQVLLHLSAFNHLNAQNTTFVYRLVQHATEKWNYLPTGTNTIQITNLKKGDYKVEVMATTAQGSWSPPQEVLVIHRLPAWWETWWAYLLYFSIFCIMFFIAIHQYLQLQKRKHLEEMDKQLMDMKFRFFINISHELRTPLTLIITPLTSIISSLENDELKRKLKAILMHANGLLQQINNLLSFRKLEMGEMKLQLRYGELNEFARQECEMFEPIFEKKGIRFLFIPYSAPLNFHFDKNIVHHILFNLLSNAHKFTPAGGEVSVRIDKQADKNIRIDVSDTGVGISPEQQKRIFERFYQGDAAVDSTHEGSGIGLNMVSEMLKIHHGSISVESQINRGATFSVLIPWELNRDEQKSIEQNNESETTIVTTPKKEQPIQVEDERMTVLLVEDNDEFRQFLAEELSGSFRVLQAGNGEEGEQITQVEQVDVVISDIMMPKVDGLELCRRLKKNDRTSHLTIILLTARAGQESELESYQHGADYYISKPFDINILMNRLMQIKRQQTIRRQELLKHIENPDVNTLFTTDIEKEFMNKLTHQLTMHLSDIDYKPETLSSDLCMSYVTAYRKIKALTGLTPGKFIRNFRLKHACQLLRSTTTSVTDIAIQIGFSSASYFTRCFIKEYNVSPSDYRKKMQEKNG